MNTIKKVVAKVIEFVLYLIILWGILLGISIAAKYNLVLVILVILAAILIVPWLLRPIIKFGREFSTTGNDPRNGHYNYGESLSCPHCRNVLARDGELYLPSYDDWGNVICPSCGKKLRL